MESVPPTATPPTACSGFYRLRFQPILWGGTALLREWGSIDRPGPVRDDHHANDQAAIVAAAKLQRSKRRRGYAQGRGGEGREPARVRSDVPGMLSRSASFLYRRYGCDVAGYPHSACMLA